MKLGVISSQVTNQIYCEPESFDAYVKSEKKFTTADPFTNCTSNLALDVLTEKINTDCDNKTSCNIPLLSENLYSNEYFPYTKPYSTEDKSKVDAFNKGHCGHHSAFFIQYPCLIPQKFKEDRKLYGLFIGCITVFIYLFVLVYLDYIKCV